MPFREINIDLESKLNIGVGIDITQECQCKCPTCFYEKRPFYKEINEELFKRIVDQAVENNFKELYLLGGEPTLHSNLFDLIEYALDKNQFNPLILVSNGLKLSSRHFCKEVADRGLMIAVQRHVIGEGKSEERIQDTVMGIKETLPIINQAFKNIEEYFDPDKVAVQCCITMPVVESLQIFKVFQYARKHGFEQVMECTKAGKHFPRGNKLDVSPDELFSVYNEFQRIDRERFPELAAKILTPQAYGKVCHMPETGVHVLINGDVVPCVGQPYVLGKLTSDVTRIGEIKNNLVEILKSDERKFFQHPEERVSGHCKEKCDYLKECTAGCRGDAYYLTGCYNASAVQCPQIMHTKELAIKDFVPDNCNNCMMESSPSCGIRDNIKNVLKAYLNDKFVE